MSALARPNNLAIYEDALLSFNAIEGLMGELAETLVNLADALTNNPEQIRLSPGAAPNIETILVADETWPSFARLQSLHQDWRAARDTLLSVWHLLSANERKSASPLPPFGAKDPTRPII